MVITIASWIVRTLYQNVSNLRLFQKKRCQSFGKLLKNSWGHYAKFELVTEKFCKNCRSSYERSDHILKKTPLTKVPANISTSAQRCFRVDMTSRRRTMSNQRWNNVVYVNAEIYNVEQLWNNVVFFNVALNNVRQCRNNGVIFNVDFHNVGQRRNNLANMTIWKKYISLNSKTK